MLRVLVLDNYDSFTYNLVQYLEVLGARCTVVYSDKIDAEGVRASKSDGVLISPGPCTPNEAGASLEVIEKLGAEQPILGVCLGHQAIAQALGGKVIRAERIMHGKTSPIEHDGRSIFAGLEKPFTATRYHSLIVERSSLPPTFDISAWTAEGEIMGLRHKEKPLEGVQFHPESILTTSGMTLLSNWVRSLEARAKSHA
jgi:anthranilate synthase/aminodeoxychorismate synthase-like glutamine amidotransferase